MPPKNLTLKAFARIVWADLGVDHGHGFASALGSSPGRVSIQPGSRNRVTINEIDGHAQSLETGILEDGGFEYVLVLGNLIDEHGDGTSDLECKVATSEKALLKAIQRIANISVADIMGTEVHFRSGPRLPSGDSSVVLIFQYEVGEYDDDVPDPLEQFVTDTVPIPKTLGKAKTAELVRLARPSAAHSLTVSKAAQAELKRRGRDHHGKKR